MARFTGKIDSAALSQTVQQFVRRIGSDFRILRARADFDRLDYGGLLRRRILVSRRSGVGGHRLDRRTAQRRAVCRHDSRHRSRCAVSASPTAEAGDTSPPLSACSSPCNRLEGYYLTPKIFGGRLNLHPMAVFLGLLIGGKLFGLLGVILAIPSIAIGKVFFKFLRELYQDSYFYHKGDHHPLDAPSENIEERIAEAAELCLPNRNRKTSKTQRKPMTMSRRLMKYCQSSRNQSELNNRK